MTTHLDESARPGLVTLALAVTAAYVAAVMYTMEHSGYNVWGGLLVAPVLLLISAPLVRRATASESDPRIAPLIMWGLVLKLASSMARYSVAFDLYGGKSDAATYDLWGAKIALQLRQFDFAIDTEKKFVGTGYTRLLTGIVYVFTGPTRIGGFLVFSWFSFWGMYFLYRAVTIALPEADSYRFAKLVFLLPSLLFWPSSIGKEAWMLLTLGLASYGAAKIYARRHGGYLLLAVGLAGSALMRPHITVIAIAAAVIGYVLRPKPPQRNVLTPIYKVVGLGIMAVMVVVVVGQASKFLNIENLSTDTVNQELEKTVELTNEGGSTFRAQGVTSPKDMPVAILTVLFRPLPTEAHNAQAMVASIEGMVLLLIIGRNWRRFLTFPRLVRRRPFLIFATSYSLLFVYAFSNFNNFGILTRQRVQVLPFMLVLLALPMPEALKRAEVGSSYPPRRELVPLGRP